MKTLVFTICFALIASLALAETTPVTVDVSKLPPEIAAQVINAQQMAEGKANPVSTAKQVEEWAVFGERFGQVIANMAKELGIAANDFVKTPVGKLAAVAIIWKTFGKDWWGILGGTLGWIICMIPLIWSYRYFHMRERVKSKEGGVSYIDRYAWKTEEARWSIFAVHICLFVIVTGVSAIIVF